MKQIKRAEYDHCSTSQGVLALLAPSDVRAVNASRTCEPKLSEILNHIAWKAVSQHNGINTNNRMQQNAGNHGPHTAFMADTELAIVTACGQ
jgi:hypothetical protein